MAYDSTIREEEVKNKLRMDYFKEYDPTPILGNIDFAVAVPTDGAQLFETEYLLWAESKKGTQANIYESFVQLILTIGKARTFDKHLPPAFLGAFDSEKIAFIPYNAVLDIFYQNDFNWKVTPSDHSTKEFLQILSTVKETLEKGIMQFNFSNDEKELRRFIRHNFVVGKSRLSKIRINKNNFTAIYQKWLKEVKPTIVVNWDVAKQNGILDADFYLADILSEHNVTLKEKLFVLLRQDYYELDRQIDEMGFFDSKKAQFNDKQVAHTQFWNRYNRPPKREYWDYIVARRDLLVPQDVRERKGSYFTPQCWVELSQQYIAAELGEDWQDEYYIWDCAAGTGNLLAGLTNKYNIWASTLDKADVDVMRDRIRNGANLLDSHVFQFDFLNDPFTKLPKQLQDIINDEEKRKKLVIYINPPYAEGDNREGKGRSGVAVSKVQQKYGEAMGYAKREIYIQFFTRIAKEIPDCTLAAFSKLKTLQAPKFIGFREIFRASLGRCFLVPANTFDNVNGDFPIGFFIYHLAERQQFTQVSADVYETTGEFAGKKTLVSYDNTALINDWANSIKDNEVEKAKGSPLSIATLIGIGNDFQNQRTVRIEKPWKPWNHQFQWQITAKNLIESALYLCARTIVDATWLNDRDQFLYPNDGWKKDVEFQNDCLAFTLFNNNIQSEYGINHWIPFTESEVDAKEKFSSHFMTDYISGKNRPINTTTDDSDIFNQGVVISDKTTAEPLVFSEEATAVFDAGRKLWKYYHSQEGANADASFYDIRLHFQGRNDKGRMNSDSADAQYTELLSMLRKSLKILAVKIEPKVYEYEFLKR